MPARLLPKPGQGPFRHNPFSSFIRQRSAKDGYFFNSIPMLRAIRRTDPA
ncbi:hypothetical protein GGD63_002046 [Bradyrhizobium sp. cir1]|nr:hypothetical protein [Bradyrhizobium sp. cir1]